MSRKRPCRAWGFALVLALLLPCRAEALTTSAASAVLIEQESGRVLYAQKKLYSLSILRVITQTAEKSHPHIAAVIMFICKPGTDVEYILHGLAKGIGNDRRLI